MEHTVHLRERWRDGSLTLLLDDMNMLSLPFLVGLVLQLLAAGKRERVTFVTSESRTQEKLARVAGLHPEATLYFRRAPSEERYRVTPAVVEPEEAALELCKLEVTCQTARDIDKQEGKIKVIALPTRTAVAPNDLQ